MANENELSNLVMEIKSYCLNNYDQGWDHPIECWSDVDYLDYIYKYKIRTLKDFVKDYGEIVEILLERRWS